MESEIQLDDAYLAQLKAVYVEAAGAAMNRNREIKGQWLGEFGTPFPTNFEDVEMVGAKAVASFAVEKYRARVIEQLGDGKAKIFAAYQMVFSLANDTKAWRMSIPVNRNRDSDCILCDGLAVAESAIAKLEAAETEVERLKAEE